MTLGAALLAAAASLAWRPPAGWLVRRRLGIPAAVEPRRWIVVAGLVAAVGLGPRLVAVSGPHVALVLVAGGVGTFTLRQVLASRRRGATVRRRAEVAELVGLMAAELRAGALASRVLAGLAAEFPAVAPAARAADLGGDVVAELRRASGRPGHELLADVAGAWLVAERSGAPLARVLDRLEESARNTRELQREVESGVAPARATGRLMALLPAVGLLLGSGMGGDPIGVLTGTWIGIACLAAGTALACAGMAWVERIATSVERDL
ncbi:MAG: hypothetical protein JWP31_2578 [Aeromicrobium sp.]|nr:hypothetical protein [Aeromicrobium sp.]